MVWSIDMDDFSGKCGNGKFPLLRALNEPLKNYRVNLEYEGPYEVHGPRGAYTTKDRKIWLHVFLTYGLLTIENFDTVNNCNIIPISSMLSICISINLIYYML